VTFIVGSLGDSVEDFLASWKLYREYLVANRGRLPSQAYDLGMADWYCNHQDPRCPHDGWLEAAVVEEPATGERQEIRAVAFRVRLLGAYHDGHIEFRYSTVFRYEMSGRGISRGHGDWLHDEFRVSDTGLLLHEIEWSVGTKREGRSRWPIEASDVEYKWLPFRR
jgi:hypothetical protein